MVSSPSVRKECDNGEQSYGYLTNYLNKGSYWKHFITWGVYFQYFPKFATRGDLLLELLWDLGGTNKWNINWFDIPWQIVGMAITATRLVSLTLLWVVVLFVTLALIQVLKLLFLIHSSGSFSIWVLTFLWDLIRWNWLMLLILWGMRRLLILWWALNLNSFSFFFFLVFV